MSEEVAALIPECWSVLGLVDSLSTVRTDSKKAEASATIGLHVYTVASILIDGSFVPASKTSPLPVAWT
jgi:hypothetical protein